MPSANPRESTIGSTALLFDAEPVVLVDDAQGGIRYWPACLPDSAAEELFEQLQERVAWVSEQRPMYDHIVDVPRLQASVSLRDPVGGVDLGAVVEQVKRLAPAAYTHVGLNFYRDGRDSVAMHNDRTHDLVDGEPISILSLGTPRDMLIRRKGKGTRAMRITLAPGSLMVMSHAAQFTHEHGIPKTSRVVGPRISCAFRARNGVQSARSSVPAACMGATIA